jgi:hypothetical protein
LENLKNRPPVCWAHNDTSATLICKSCKLTACEDCISDHKSHPNSLQELNQFINYFEKVLPGLSFKNEIYKNVTSTLVSETENLKKAFDVNFASFVKWRDNFLGGFYRINTCIENCSTENSPKNFINDMIIINDDLINLNEKGINEISFKVNEELINYLNKFKDLIKFKINQLRSANYSTQIKETSFLDQANTLNFSNIPNRDDISSIANQTMNEFKKKKIEEKLDTMNKTQVSQNKEKLIQDANKTHSLDLSHVNKDMSNRNINETFDSRKISTGLPNDKQSKKSDQLTESSNISKTTVKNVSPLIEKPCIVAVSQTKDDTNRIKVFVWNPSN